MVELISPVQDFVSLHAALNAGADAVYFGLKRLSMRAGAKNFSLYEIKRVVNECKKKGVKAYLTLNTIVYEREIPLVKRVLRKTASGKQYCATIDGNGGERTRVG